MSAADLDRVWAYRASTSTTAVRVHAVTWPAMASGAMDAECGVIGRVPMGDWGERMPYPPCPDCARVLAAAVPEPPAAPRPRVLPRRHRRRVVVSADQLDVLTEMSAA